MKTLFLLLITSLAFCDYKISDNVNIALSPEVKVNTPGMKVFAYQVKGENKFVINFEKKITEKKQEQAVPDSILKYFKVLTIKNKTRMILIFKEEVKYSIQASHVKFTSINAKPKDIKKAETGIISEFKHNTLNKIKFFVSNQPLELFFGFKPDFTLYKTSDLDYNLEILNVEQPAKHLLLPYYPTSAVKGIVYVQPKFEANKLTITIHADQKISAFSNETGIIVKLTE